MQRTRGTNRYKTRQRHHLLGLALFTCAPMLVCGLSGGCNATVATKVANTPHSVTESSQTKDNSSIAATAITDDWSLIRQRGTLRVLVHAGAAYVPRAGSPIDRELAAIELFARAAGLDIDFVSVDARSEIIDALLAGKGDVIVAHLTNTTLRRQRVRFTQALRTISEQVVTPANDTNAPQRLADLSGRTLHLRPSSSYAEWLPTQTFLHPPTIKPLSERLDALNILSKVGSGTIGLSIVDSDAVEAYQAYRSDVRVAFTLRKEVPIAWAVRPSATTLHRQLNQFIKSYITHSHSKPTAALTLKAIQARGVLRVVLPNTGSGFFFYQGQPMGFQYVMAQKLCAQLGVRLEVVVPRSKSDMIPLLVEGHADLVAATLTVTPHRSSLVDFATPLMHVDEVIVQSSRKRPIRSVQELGGRTVVVHRNSSYARTLTAIQASVPSLHILFADDMLSSDELIDGVARGKYDLTVSDYSLVAGYLAYRTDIVDSLRIGKKRPIAYAVRKGNSQLKAVVDQFSSYWAQQLSQPKSTAEQRAPNAEYGDNPYPSECNSLSAQYDISSVMIHRWMRAVSNGDPTAVSWFGGQGLLGVMPHIAKRLGVDPTTLTEPLSGLDAGVRWLVHLRGQLPDTVTPTDRLKMALAATRIGMNHILDAIALAKERGWDPNRWDGHVSRALRELTRPEVASNTRYGYCPGTEAVRFVSRVFQDL